jgi:hypothetical protein
MSRNEDILPDYFKTPNIEEIGRTKIFLNDNMFNELLECMKNLFKITKYNFNFVFRNIIKNQNSYPSFKKIVYNDVVHNLYVNDIGVQKMNLSVHLDWFDKMNYLTRYRTDIRKLIIKRTIIKGLIHVKVKQNKNDGMQTIIYCVFYYKQNSFFYYFVKETIEDEKTDVKMIWTDLTNHGIEEIDIVEIEKIRKLLCETWPKHEDIVLTCDVSLNVEEMKPPIHENYVLHSSYFLKGGLKKIKIKTKIKIKIKIKTKNNIRNGRKKRSKKKRVIG